MKNKSISMWGERNVQILNTFSTSCRTLFVSFVISFLCMNTISCSGDDYDDSIIDISNNINDYVGINKDTLIIAHWNIGHFSLGKSSETTISENNYIDKLVSYRNLIDTLNVDLIGICEYNFTFDTTGRDAYDLLFNEFPYYYIGPKYAYNCNASFFKFPILQTKSHIFKEAVQNRYYICTSFFFNHVEVKLIETHLDWNQGARGNKYRIRQMMDLAEEFKNDSHVIICADYNSSDIEEYDCFFDYGFSLAFYEHDTNEVLSTIDNIIYKGFKLVKKDVINDYTLSDHPLLRSSFILE